MCNHQVLMKIDSKWTYDDDEFYECMDCGDIVNLDNKPVHQCEFCDSFYTSEPVPYPDPDSPRHHLSTFCCDECAEEAYQEVVWGEREAQRECEIYGDDVDSWYR